MLGFLSSSALPVAAYCLKTEINLGEAGYQWDIVASSQHILRLKMLFFQAVFISIMPFPLVTVRPE